VFAGDEDLRRQPHPGGPDARPGRPATHRHTAAHRRHRAARPSSAARLPATISRMASRCCITTLRATPRPIMPSVSLTRVSASTCSRSSLTSVWRVRRCRSNASLTRRRSSLIAAETVSSSARLRPLRLPRACSSSSSLGSCRRDRKSGAGC
jgi:hypothetical protein